MKSRKEIKNVLFRLLKLQYLVSNRFDGIPFYGLRSLESTVQLVVGQERVGRVRQRRYFEV